MAVADPRHYRRDVPVSPIKDQTALSVVPG